MKKIYFYLARNTKYFFNILFLLVFQMTSAQEFCIDATGEQKAGTEDGYRYELWNQNSQGSACMTLGEGALFEGEWSGILNYLSRRGLSYDQTKEHQEYGRFSTTYNCNYNPSNSSSGNSYLSVYGWTVDPLIEYYIIEDWRNWIPSMANDAQLVTTFTVDGSEYEIYENTRVDKPSIQGNTTFQQYFSIRKNERSSGSIDISAHFDKWESLGLNLGKLHEVSFVVEGYQSNGSFEFTELDVVVDDSGLSVDEFNAQQYFQIYQNPNTRTATIQFKKSGQKADIMVYNIEGKVVFNQNAIQSELVEISNLKRGMYFVLVEIDNTNYTSKLLLR